MSKIQFIENKFATHLKYSGFALKEVELLISANVVLTYEKLQKDTQQKLINQANGKVDISKMQKKNISKNEMAEMILEKVDIANLFDYKEFVYSFEEFEENELTDGFKTVYGEMSEIMLTKFYEDLYNAFAEMMEDFKNVGKQKK